MPYEVGISTGWWSLAKQSGGGGDLLGMAAKVAYGATAGITFTQIDLETVTEFLEPDVQRKLKQITKGLGMKVGLHAETHAMALESADRVEWEQAHRRLVEAIHYSVKFGFVYLNIHTCEKQQLWTEEARIRPFGHQYQNVAPDGLPFYHLCDRSAVVKEYLMNNLHPFDHSDDKNREEFLRKKKDEVRQAAFKDMYARIINSEGYKQRMADWGQQLAENKITAKDYNNLIAKLEREAGSEAMMHANREAEENLGKHITSEEKYKVWKTSRFGKYFVHWGEIGAYLLVAHYMYKTGHPLWKQIAGDADPDDCYHSDQKKFNAAVSAFYIYTHLTLKDHEWNKKYLDGMNVIEYVNKNKFYLLFETPEAKGNALEGLLRLYDPVHAYYFLKYVNSPYIKMCIDFEHVLSQKIEIEKMLKELPKDAGSMIHLFHLTKPVPYGGAAHIQLMRGSRTQEIIYKWLFELRKRGFKDGIMIYERGGGQHPQEVVKESVLVLRLFKEYLEKDIAPDELPVSFYGISDQNEPEFKRQLVSMRDHAWDPLAGMLMIPEEAHTFFSRSAVEKGKAEEWKKGKFR